MLENNKLLFGTIFIIGGIILLYYNFKNFDYKKDNAWDYSMLFQGLIGGLALVIIGIILLINHFNNIIY